jgi:hypothetical protein
MTRPTRDKFGRKLQPAASPELLRHLRGIASAMMDPFRTETTKGHTRKRTTASGWTSTYVFAPYPNHIGLSNIDPSAVRALGSILMRISNGENAYTLFRQNERTKPSMHGDHQVGAMAYWARFARNPESAANRKAAISAARRILPSLERLSDATIKRIAGDHRDDVLPALELRVGVSFPITSRKRIKTLGPEKIAALRAYLDKKSGKRNVDE